MMASDANSHQDTTEARFLSQKINLTSDYHQSQYLNSGLCMNTKHDPVRFISQQQQQQLYESHQEHKSFIQEPNCDCYQSGGNQICSRCQTNQGQNNAGAFIYQTIQADDAVQFQHSSSECPSRMQSSIGNQQQQQQSTGYSSSTSSPTSSSSSSSSLGKKLDFQEPIYENNIKYYLKQPQCSELTGYNNNNNNNATGCSSQTSDLISDRCQTTRSFINNSSTSNSNSNNDNNNIIIENDPSGSLFYQCSNNNEQLAHYAGCNSTTHVDWKTRSLNGVPSAVGQDKLFNCNIDSNNNTAEQFSSQYSLVQNAQDIKETACQLGYQQFNNNNDSDNFTSIQHYDNYQLATHHQCESASFSSSFEQQQPLATNQHIDDNRLGVVVDYNQSSIEQQQQQQSQSSQLQLEPCSPFAPNLDSSACFSSSSGEISSSSGQHQQLPATIDHQPTAAKSKARRKNPAALTKVNGKLWEFIRDLLLSDRTNPAFIRWERREDGVFKFVQSNKVAKMWGERKQNPKMTYEKLSRAMRYYYKSKVLLPVFGRRLVYKFGPNASGWNETG